MLSAITSTLQLGRTYLLLALPVAMLFGDVAGWQSPAQFVSRAHFVSIDVSVVDRNGQVVRGLTAADFDIREDGRAQMVEAFQWVDLGVAASETSTLGAPEVDVVTNQSPGDRRLIVILLDDAMMPFDGQMIQTAKRIAGGVVDRLGPDDLAAVIFTRDNRRAQNFTSDKTRLRASIETLTSGGFEPPTTESGLDLPVPFYRDAANALVQTIDVLGKVPDRRKAVVYVTTGIPLRIGSPESARSDWPQVNWLVRRAITLAQQNNVNVYTVDPGGLDGMRGLMRRRQTRTEAWLQEELERLPGLYTDFLRVMADNTGGRAYTNTNSFTAELTQLIEHAGAYYLLGYRSSNTREDGRFRRIQVRVRRPGLTVRARAGYYSTAPGDGAKAAAVEPLRAAIAGLLPNPGLPMFLHAVTSLGSDGVPEIDATVGIQAIDRADAGSRQFDVEVTAFTTLGAQVTRLRERVELQGGEDHADTTFRLRLKPGRYELRAAGSSVAGTGAGSVFGYVDVPDANSSTLLWGVGLGRRDVVRGIALTTRRTFSRDDRVVAVAQGRCRPGETDGLHVSWQLRDSAGTAVHQTREVVDGARCQAREVASLAFELPLDRLAPGVYRLEVRAQQRETVETRDIAVRLR